jgi:alkaline phosphatase
LTRRFVHFLSVLLILTIIPANASAGETPKNIILLIGDGMGAGQVTLGRLSTQAEGKKLNMDSMKVAAQVQTKAANSPVTDSAAAGTAFATGWKTNVGMISVLPDGTPVTTIVEAAQLLKKSTGLVTTTTITDATPAVFAAHVGARGEMDEIADQMMQHKINVLLGGGKAYFIPKSQTGSKRKDESDLLLGAKQAGYSVVGTREELLQVRSGYLLGLFQLENLTTEAPEPRLAELADKAIQVLSANRSGFFLMIEGGEIDHKAHNQDAPGVVKQFRDFDDAVGVALAFARRDKNTLVIVTADHETGGLAVLAAGRGAPEPWSAGWSSKGHSGNVVPLLAEGPGAPQFGGVLDNTDIPKSMAKLWKLKSFPEKKAVPAKPVAAEAKR